MSECVSVETSGLIAETRHAIGMAYVHCGSKKPHLCIINLAHCECKSLLYRSSRLSVVCLSVLRQISITQRDRREISSLL